MNANKERTIVLKQKINNPNFKEEEKDYKKSNIQNLLCGPY